MLADGNDLVPMMKVDVLRKSMRVDTGNSLMEVSIDLGQILTENGNEPISEVEIELFQGDEQNLLETGLWLSEKYGLESEERSKFARGLALLQEDNR